ncbi:formin-like protein 3 [Ischnura elegans]|uniref:formin-like protein 3 n=1 Tax=Ischnura elegans TaxID=197161 RepID=UPI001ED8B798|nr:formin-like protein 3 [Ischnura elegans]
MCEARSAPWRIPKCSSSPIPLRWPPPSPPLPRRRSEPDLRHPHAGRGARPVPRARCVVGTVPCFLRGKASEESGEEVEATSRGADVAGSRQATHPQCPPPPTPIHRPPPPASHRSQLLPAPPFPLQTKRRPDVPSAMELAPVSSVPLFSASEVAQLRTLLRSNAAARSAPPEAPQVPQELRRWERELPPRFRRRVEARFRPEGEGVGWRRRRIRWNGDVIPPTSERFRRSQDRPQWPNPILPQICELRSPPAPRDAPSGLAPTRPGKFSLGGADDRVADPLWDGGPTVDTGGPLPPPPMYQAPPAVGSDPPVKLLAPGTWVTGPAASLLILLPTPLGDEGKGALSERQ